MGVGDVAAGEDTFTAASWRDGVDHVGDDALQRKVDSHHDVVFLRCAFRWFRLIRSGSLSAFLLWYRHQAWRVNAVHAGCRDGGIAR